MQNMTSQMKLHLMLLSVAITMTVMEAQKSLPVTQQTLQQVASSLQMYADALPQMPTIYGYSVTGGNPVSVNLTIGMYRTKWVTSYILICAQYQPPKERKQQETSTMILQILKCFTVMYYKSIFNLSRKTNHNKLNRRLISVVRS
jgi:hypothetical protein